MKTILLVDDEKWVRTALKWTINKLGLPLQIIHECVNGLDASDWIKRNEVDLIITDVRMPIMCGLSLAKELNQLNRRQDLIVISGHNEFHLVQQALRNGVIDYLLKPIEETELRECLENWLTKRTIEESKRNNQHEKDDTFPASPIEQVLYYIEKTPLDQITLKDAAKCVHMNPSYLSHLFKQQLNIKFVEYITELRIEESKKLLQHTALRISEIAERAGYSDIAYFSNNFKRITGCSPSEYRKSVI
ncbi:response regulator transcription factor [Bacillus sp. USDA818B3_A]|uniref:response regulator transcription factor n=1 Tax=Bacillus sp. USDA818B3_A TaxID=2698834 RepID=UPI00136B6FB5|nr:helix-turn-helix domain-containing protein [Bacillus sp. USDA818B3_A]